MTVEQSAAAVAQVVVDDPRDLLVVDVVGGRFLALRDLQLGIVKGQSTTEKGRQHIIGCIGIDECNAAAEVRGKCIVKTSQVKVSLTPTHGDAAAGCIEIGSKRCRIRETEFQVSGRHQDGVNSHRQ